MTQLTLYHVSEKAGIDRFEPRAAVTPGEQAEAAREGVELRILPTLWPLRDAVVASSLQFSIIRMRNAQPRPRD